ncbi:MAG TPA: VOC family protein [Thermoanaerobaculia bacterium]
MAVKPIPEGLHTVTPYLVVSGVARLIDFLKQAFDATEMHRSTRPDGTIMHAQVRIGDSPIMMGEVWGEFPAKTASLYLYVEDCDALYKRALAAGAVSIMEPMDMFYGDRNGGVRDFAGNEWWIATHIEDVPPAELERRAEEAMKRRQRG